MSFAIERLNALIQQLFGFDKKINFSGREIEIQLKDGTTISPQQLSSGEKHLLKLFIEVVSVAESSIIIDEPELSMHIDWQKTLLQNMNMLNSSAQLIVATHSPEVMSGIEDSKIFRI
jgi:predicted ATPase